MFSAGGLRDVTRGKLGREGKGVDRVATRVGGEGSEAMRARRKG